MNDNSKPQNSAMHGRYFNIDYWNHNLIHKNYFKGIHLTIFASKYDILSNPISTPCKFSLLIDIADIQI
jgi:hypothetical protein